MESKDGRAEEVGRRHTLLISTLLSTLSATTSISCCFFDGDDMVLESEMTMHDAECRLSRRSDAAVFVWRAIAGGTLQRDCRSGDDGQWSLVRED